MIDFSEQKAKEEHIKSIQLSVRETQEAAIQLFSGKDYLLGVKIPSMLLLMAALLREYTLQIYSANTRY